MAQRLSIYKFKQIAMKQATNWKPKRPHSEGMQAFHVNKWLLFVDGLFAKMLGQHVINHGAKLAAL